MINIFYSCDPCLPICNKYCIYSGVQVHSPHSKLLHFSATIVPSVVKNPTDNKLLGFFIY